MRLFIIPFLLIFSSPLIALELDGNTEFSRMLQLNSSVSGKIAKIHVSVGQSVKKGDLLIELVPTRFQSELDIAQAGLDSLMPTLLQLKTELEKAEELFDRDSLARVELQQAQQSHDAAMAQTAVAEAKLEIARLNLAETRILSPTNARVLSVDTHLQRYINTTVADPTLLTLVDDRQMLVRVLLPAENWSSQLINRPARVSFLKNHYRGKVIGIGQQRISGANNHPALALIIRFEADGKVPANVLVRVNIEEN
ncbi:MAG: RND family efflux transporter MFP subunit [Planctomycetota bacterium]|jgi:RND family efflux transporter MFP subunit